MPLYLWSQNSENNCIFRTLCRPIHKSADKSQYWPLSLWLLREKQPRPDLNLRLLTFTILHKSTWIHITKAWKGVGKPNCKKHFENYQIITSSCHRCYATNFFYSIVECVSSWFQLFSYRRYKEGPVHCGIFNPLDRIKERFSAVIQSSVNSEWLNFILLLLQRSVLVCVSVSVMYLFKP